MAPGYDAGACKTKYTGDMRVVRPMPGGRLRQINDRIKNRNRLTVPTLFFYV